VSSRILKDTIKRLLEDSLPAQTAAEEATASLDLQVKKFIRESIKSSQNSKNEGSDFRSLCRRLFEADDEEKEKEEEPKEEDDVQEPQKKSVEELDLASFTESIVRLLDNFESLIEIRDTVVKMSKNELSKYYDTTTVDAFMDFLEEEYDVEVGETKWDKETENQPPPAKGAGPDGSS
jgi:hypothetical protein